MQDRTALRLFGVLLVSLATLAYIPIVQAGSLGALGGWALPLIMWAPGLSGIVVSLAVYRSVRPLGLGLTRKSLAWIAICYLLPLAYTLAIYLPLERMGVVALGGDNLSLGYVTLGLFNSMLFATGEELGWRGVAAPIVARQFGFIRGQIGLGLVWFVYHLPALLFTGYGKSPLPVFGNAMFLVSVLGLSVFLGWTRLSGRSVWPAAVLHASHNLLFLHLFDPMERRSTSADWLIGEQGVCLAVVLTLAALYGVRAFRRQELRQEPQTVPA